MIERWILHLVRCYEMRRLMRGRWTPRLEQLRWNGVPLRRALRAGGLLHAWRTSRAPAWQDGPLPLVVDHLPEPEREILAHPLFAAFGRDDRPARAQVAWDLMRWPRLLVRHAKYLRAERIPPVLERLYTEVNRLLADLGIEYWLDWGTLLGHHRDGGLMPRDYDVDFGALAEDCPRIWQARHRLPPGFTMCDASYRYGSPKLYVSLDDWKADLYFYTPRGDRLQCFGDTDYPCCVEPFPADLVLPTTPACMLGQATRVPARVRQYLVRRYGEIRRGAVRDPATGYFR